MQPLILHYINLFSFMENVHKIMLISEKAGYIKCNIIFVNK